MQSADYSKLRSVASVAFSPDGARVAYTVENNDTPGRPYRQLWVMNPADGKTWRIGGEKDRGGEPYWSPDGQYLVYTRFSGETNIDLWLLPIADPQHSIPLLRTPANERGARISPDGRWMAYASDETGRSEVYVQEFPEPQNKWQISANGGRQPHWSSDGRQLYFRDALNAIMVAAVETNGPFKAGAPQKRPQTRFAPILLRSHYRPAKDGRFLVLAPAGAEDMVPISVVMNWTSAIRN